MTGHTKEPWAQHEDDQRAIVAIGEPHLSLLTVGDDGIALIYSEEDATRIVACVNACAGISTDELQMMNDNRETLRQFYDAKIQRVLKAEENENEKVSLLLGALITIMRMDVKGHQLQDRLQFTPTGREILEQATAAIYAAHGGAL